MRETIYGRIRRITLMVFPLLMAIVSPAAMANGGPETANLQYSKLVRDPTDANVLYLTHQAGIFKSRDAGATWTNYRAGFPAFSWIGPAIAIHPGDPTLLYIGTSYGVYVSADAGATWQPLSEDSPWGVSALAIDPQNPYVIYAGTGGLGL